MLKLTLCVLLISYCVVANYDKNPEEGELFEGDIAGVEVGGSETPTPTRVLWPYGVIPFEINTPAFTNNEILLIKTGMRLVEDRTRFGFKECIKFVPRTTETIYVRIVKAGGCWSYIGRRTTNGAQLLSMDCEFSIGTVAHELIHVLGFFHEQSRPDRDLFIDVIYENIATGLEENFMKYNDSQVDEVRSEYDFSSLMHFPEVIFSKNGKPTIRPKVPTIVIGQRRDLSGGDIDEIRAVYDCRPF